MRSPECATLTSIGINDEPGTTKVTSWTGSDSVLNSAEPCHGAQFGAALLAPKWSGSTILPRGDGVLPRDRARDDSSLRGRSFGFLTRRTESRRRDSSPRVAVLTTV